MTLDDFIQHLADGDSNDAEVAGLTAALHEAYGHIPGALQEGFLSELPEILKNASETRF